MLIIRRSKLSYTASGIITLVDGLPVHRLREDLSHPVHRLREDLSHPVHRLREDLSQPVYGTATYRCDDTTCCIIQF